MLPHPHNKAAHFTASVLGLTRHDASILIALLCISAANASTTHRAAAIGNTHSPLTDLVCLTATRCCAQTTRVSHILTGEGSTLWRVHARLGRRHA